MQPQADRAWFTFHMTNGPDFKVFAFEGHEGVSELYEWDIELVQRKATEDLLALLGREACLRILDRSGEARLVHGVIREMEQLHTGNAFTHYRCRLVPRFWFLQQNCEHRIFQNLSVPDIIKNVLQQQGFTGGSWEMRFFSKYEPREYCVQYGESDFHFINRLCEEEGLYYFFEHNPSSHVLCFGDMPGGKYIPGKFDVRYFQGSGERSDSAVISRLNLHQKINSNAATYREWNFTKPSLNLESKTQEPDSQKAPVPGGVKTEQYQFPHLYQLRQPGSRYVDIQLLRQLTWHTWIAGEADVSRFTPGHVFSIYGHGRKDINARWWTARVSHQGEQPQSLEHEAPERGMTYKATFTAIPERTRFVPELLHPKVRVDGLQSAIVTGPSGEEIYTDEYGRVKVQFHWDRLGAKDEKTTCWVRVADTWAGMNFGFIQIPRIGQEVIVEYMEGDPDRPVITGRVYNKEKMPPWQLPEQKAISGIQSREIKAGRRNQLVLDDTQGEIQAQISSDHLLSQLNLGYLTRVNHIEGRKDFRGEGFELRTDGWGVVRAARGIYVSTYPRNSAEQHQKDLQEATALLESANEQHKNTSQLAETCGAQEYGKDTQALSGTLDTQLQKLKGSGKKTEEMEQAHILFSSPDGILATTPKSTHLHTGEHTTVSSGAHTSFSAGRSFLVSALEKVSIFAHKMGMRLMAARGKVEIEAQSDMLNMISEKDMRIFSVNGKLHISSPKEILLTAGGSYIKISEDGIEQGTSKGWTVHAATHAFEGGKTKNYLTKSWKDGEVPLGEKVVVRDELGRYLNLERYAKKDSQNIAEGAKEHNLILFHDTGGTDATMQLEQNQQDKSFSAHGTNLRLTGEYSNPDDAAHKAGQAKQAAPAVQEGSQGKGGDRG